MPPVIGEIRMFAGNYAPVGWEFCDGQQLPIAEYEILFNLIGTTYGGDGDETFCLPNLQSRVPMHMSLARQLAEMAGQETVTLTTGQIPGHTHSLRAVDGTAASATPAGNLPAEPSKRIYGSTASPAAMSASAVQPAGGSQPHDNMQPFLAVSFIISLFGEFPAQV